MVGAAVCLGGLVLLCLYLMGRLIYELAVALFALDIERRDR